MASNDVVAFSPSPPRPLTPCPLTLLRPLISSPPRTLRLPCTTHLHRSVASQPPRPLVLPPARPRTPARSPSPSLAPSAPRTLDPSTAPPAPRECTTSPPSRSPRLGPSPPHASPSSPDVPIALHRPLTSSPIGPSAPRTLALALRHDAPTLCPIAPSLPRTPAISPSCPLDPSPHAPLALRRPLSSSLTRPLALGP